MKFDGRITMDPDICHGKPCVRGLRYPVTMLLELLASGMTHAEILADYPDLEEADLLACLEYAARLEHLRQLAAESFATLDRGEGVTLNGPEELAAHIAEIGRRRLREMDDPAKRLTHEEVWKRIRQRDE